MKIFTASSIDNLPNCTMQLLGHVSASASKAIGRPRPGSGCLVGDMVDLEHLTRSGEGEKQERGTAAILFPKF